MGISVNTNMQALRVQDNLNKATLRMNAAMDRMSSGSRINRAGDDAAGYAVSKTLSIAISGAKVASDNAAIGNDLLSTAEGTLNVIAENLQRIQDLTEQAANGTYTSSDLSAIASEVTARLSQVTALADSTSFNGKKLLDGSCSTGITLQVGTTASDTLALTSTIFNDVTAETDLSGLADAITAGTAGTFLASIDSAVSGITTRITDIGAASNRLSAVSEGLNVQKTNLTSALSTIKDADVAEESASYVQSQILQSASATLLVQANSAPQVALTLIKG